MLAMPAAPSRMDSNEELDLVARLVAGDESGLAEMYDTFSALVLGVARRITVDPTASEDVVQEVFLHVWQRPEQVDLARCSLRGWLSVLAHRRAVDWVRRQERARSREERAGLEAEFKHGEVVDLADWALAVDRGDRARAAVASLPIDQRRAIELAYWSGRTYREVGVELGIPEGTAKSRLRLGLARLAVLLDEADVS